MFANTFGGMQNSGWKTPMEILDVAEGLLPERSKCSKFVKIETGGGISERRLLLRINVSKFVRCSKVLAPTVRIRQLSRLRDFR